MPLCEQLGNVGSEVGRALRARRDGRTERAEAAFDRALALIDLTVTGDIRFSARREVCRARELLVDYFVGDNEYASTPDLLERYFDAFALKARLHR